MRKKYSYLCSFLVILIIFAAIFFSIINKERPPLDLDGFYKLTTEDPLFYSPFFDQKNFQEAADNLALSEEQLKKVIIENLDSNSGNTNNSYIQILKETSLFPHQFLKDLILISSKTEEFKKNPSVELSQNLLNLYNNAADSYIQNISGLIKAVNLAGTEEKKASYLFFIDSATSVDIVKNDLLVIQNNGYALKEEIRKRQNCLLGKEPCQILLKKKDQGAFFDSLNTTFNLTGEKINFIRNHLPFSSQNDVKGPYKISSSCWQNPSSEQWLYLIYTNFNDRAAIVPKLANQNYYYKLPPLARVKTDEILLKKNIKFNLQPEANTYECINLDFYPKLLTLDFLKNQLNEKKITQDDLINNLDYQLLIENQFGLIAPAINTVAYQLKTLRLYTSTDKKSFSPEYLFLVRSAYSIFYFPFAKSIWRSDEQLQYFAPEEEIPPFRGSNFITFDELENLGYTKEKIAKFHIGVPRILETLQKNQSQQ